MQVDWQWQIDIRSDEFIASIIQCTAEEYTLLSFYWKTDVSQQWHFLLKMFQKKMKQG